MESIDAALTTNLLPAAAANSTSGEDIASSESGLGQDRDSDENEASEPTSAKGIQSDPKTPTATLSRSTYVVWLVLAFALLALFQWILLCFLTYRPVTRSRYGLYMQHGTQRRILNYSYDFSHLFSVNVRWLRAARVIQAIVGTLTIPITSAVCARAAVIFMQRRRQRTKDLTLRQTVALADKGWNQPEILWNILGGEWKRFVSAFLVLAFLLTTLVIPPAQQIFLDQRTTKTPTTSIAIGGLTDILDQFPGDSLNLVGVLTRSVLSSTYDTDIQLRLWTRGAENCTLQAIESEAFNHDQLGPCNLGGNALTNMSQLSDPFLAQLPNGYSTGVIRQFLPRINSSATREVITAENYPSNCNAIDGSFAVNFASTPGSDATWTLEACMPGNMSVSPWRATRMRHDFSETLYLNITYDSFSSGGQGDGGLYRIALNTTAGFFELPNYMNGQTSGPLLVGDPTLLCGSDCVYGFHVPYDNQTFVQAAHERDDAAVQNNTLPPIVSLQAVPNKGPLLTIAMALFGDNSYIDEQLTNANSNLNATLTNSYVCVDLIPMEGLLQNPQFRKPPNEENLCTQQYAGQSPSSNQAIIEDQLSNLVTSLYYEDPYYPGTIANGFEAAAFLVNELWLTNNAQVPTYTVFYDIGANTEIPVISEAGMIFVSILWISFLGSLFAMAIYSARSPRWTNQLDAFAMMRVGALISKYMPLHISKSALDVEILDEMPGWVGNSNDAEIGELALGADTRLRLGRQYRSVETSNREKRLRYWHRGKWNPIRHLPELWINPPDRFHGA